MTDEMENYGKLWTRKELILAFDLYCRIPFQKTKASNSEVRRLAEILNRTPASVARKLGNFGAFDPELKKRNISGLAHVGRLDREVWEEFHKDWNSLVLLANQLKCSLGAQSESESESDGLVFPNGPSERLGVAKQRIHQSFFREAVISSYENRCCITGISITECLIASHIVPWNVDEQHRADPTNGLCLSATFDRLFDSGLITVSKKQTVLVAKRICNAGTTIERELICKYDGKAIMSPRRFSPSEDRLRWHRTNLFKG